MEKVLRRLKRKLTVENLWLYIIKILLDEGRPVRAYSFRKYLRERYGIDPSTITVYMVVYRMTGEGLIEKVEIGSETLYRVTDKGVKAYMEGLKIMHEILGKLTPPSPVELKKG